jgi:hypothetical protein
MVIEAGDALQAVKKSGLSVERRRGSEFQARFLQRLAAVSTTGL